MPLDYIKRLDELEQDNPYAADYGYTPGDPAALPDFSHLSDPTVPLTNPQVDPQRPSEAGPPDFSHMADPTLMEQPEPVGSRPYAGSTDQNYFEQGVNTYARATTAGAVDLTGQTMQGAAADPLGWLAGVEKLMPYRWGVNALGYRTPTQMLADAARPEKPIGFLDRAGKAVSEFADSPELTPPPAWQGGLTESFGRATGSLLPPLAVGAVTGGGAAGIAVTAITSAWAESQQQVEEALRNGATPEQVKEAARMASVGGLTEPLPIEMIFNRIPVPLWGKAIGIFGKLAKNAVAEGGQEVLQQFIQNFAEKYTYNPKQDLTEGMVQAGGIGAILGGGAGAAVDLAQAGAPTTAPPGGTPPGGTPPPGTAPPVVPPGTVPPAPTPGALPPVPGVPPGPPGAPPPGTPPVPGAPPVPGVPPAPPGVPPAPAGVPGVPGAVPAPAPLEADEEAMPALPPDEEPPPEMPAAADVGAVSAPSTSAPEAPAAPLPDEVVPPELPPSAPLTAPAIAPEPAAAATGPRTPSQVQQATGAPYAEAAAIAESEGWQAPAAPEAAPDFSHLADGAGTRRRPLTTAAGLAVAGDRVNLEASDAQRAAKNVEVGHFAWQGRQIGIEVPSGGVRRSVDLTTKEPQPVESNLPEGVAYGRFKRTRSRKAEVKVFIGQNLEAPNAYIVDQIDPVTGQYDEPKTLVGFNSQPEAQAAYESAFTDGRGAQRIGSISEVPVADFKKWLTSDRTQRPYDRKATAASRRLRQAYTAEAGALNEGQIAPGPTPDAGQLEAPQAGVAPEQGEVQVPGPEVQREAAPGWESWWDSAKVEHRNEILNAAGVQRSPKLSWKRLGQANQAKLQATLEALSPTGQAPASTVAEPTPAPDFSHHADQEILDAEAIRSDTGQAEEGDAVRPGPIPRGGDLQQQAQGTPGYGEERPGAVAQGQEEVAAAPLAERWDSLPFAVKEPLLDRARVSRSPVTSWKSLGEENQRKLEAAHASEPTIAAAATREDYPDVTPEQTHEVRSIVKKIAGDVRVEFADVIAPTSEGAAHYGQSEIMPGATTRQFWDRRDGRRVSALLTFAMKGEGAHTIEHAFHEAWHAVERALGRPNAKILKAAMPRLRAALKSEYKIVDELSEQEVLAHGFGLWGAGRYKDIHIGLRKYYRAVKEFLRRLRIGLQPSAKTVEDIYREVERGKYRNAPQFRHQTFTREGAMADMPAAGASESTVSAAIGADRPVAGRISTLQPTSKKAPADTHTHVITAQDVAESQNAGLVARYLGMGKFRDAPAITAGKAYVDWQVENLLFLFHSIPKGIRAQSKRWYAGANMLSKAWADMYGLPSNSVSGMMAVLSPQKDWFQNASLAQRILDINKRFSKEPWTPAMTKKWNSISALKRYRKQRNKIGSKSLSELTDKTERALWIRIYDETYLPRDYRAIHPSGKLGGFVQIEKGPKKKRVMVNAKVTWGSLGEIAKADQAYHSGGDIKTLSKLMGNAHKVRNFFNNINVPWDRIFKDVTIDTHAVAAAHLQPFSGKSPEVSHILGTGLALPEQFKLAAPLVAKDARYQKQYGRATWKTIAAWKKAKADTKGSAKPDTRYDRWHRIWKAAQERQGGGYKGPKGSAITGVKGTYGYGAEAYRIAAAKEGVLPREMQSITWEAIRSIFTAASKRNPKFVEKMRGFWRDVDAGKITAAEARVAILKEAGGVKDPSWASGSAGLHDPREASTYAADVYRPELVRGEAAGRGGSGRAAGARAAAPGVESTTSATISLGRRPIRPPSPGATFQMPEERLALGGRVNLTAVNRALADRAEAAERLDTGLEATGQVIPGDLKLARAIDLYESSTGEKGKQLIERRVKPLIEGIRRTGRTFEDFDAYLYAASAIHENPRLRAKGAASPDPSGMSDIDAHNILAAAHSDFAGLAQHVYAMNRESLRRQYNAGLIDLATYNELSTRSHYWVPHRGWEAGEGDDFVPTGQGFDLRGPAFRRRLGRFSKADSPLAYSIQAAHAGMVRSSKNRVAQTLHRLAKQFKNDAFWTVDKAQQESYEYEDPATGVKEIRQRWVPPRQLANRAAGIKDTIVAWEGGVPHYITVHNAGLLTALRIMGSEESNTLMRGMGNVLKTIGKLYTTYNPNFVVRNFFRDLETALIQMGEHDLPGLRMDVVKSLPSTGRAVWKYLRGQTRPAGAVSHTRGQKPTSDEMLQYAHDFAMDGGKISWIESKSIEQQKRDLAKAINAKNVWHKTKATKDFLFNFIEDANGSVENAMRLSLYVELRKRGYSRAQSASAAKEITVNFNKKGTMGQAINSIYLFFNAQVQGNVKMAKSLHRSKKVRVAATMLAGLGFLMDFINRWSGGDDDEGLNRWDNVPQWEKERNLIFMWNGNKWKIPLSFGYNVFYVGGQQMASAIANKTGMGQGTEMVDAAWNIMHATLHAASPLDIVRPGLAGLAPTLFAPAVEIMENQNYQGAPIYPTKYDPKDPDAELYFKSVHPFWRELAGDLAKYTKFDARKPPLMDWSPETFEHLANTYFGGAGQFWWSQAATNVVKLGYAAATQTAPDIEARDIPLVREVYGSTDTPQAKQNTYYDVWDKVDYLHRSMKDATDSAERRALKEKYPVEAQSYGGFESAEKYLRDQRKLRKKVEENDRLSGEQRQRRLDAIEKRIQDIQHRALTNYGHKQQQALH